MAASKHPERFVLVSLKLLNASERSGFSYGSAVGSTGLGLVLDSVPVFWLARRYHSRAVALAAEIEHPAAFGTACMGLALHNTCLGEWEAVIEYAHEAARAYHETGDVHGWGYTALQRVRALVRRGEFNQALMLCQDMARTGDDAADPQIQCWGLHGQGLVQLRMGRLDQAAHSLTGAVQLAEGMADYGFCMMAGTELGRCYLRKGQLQQAISALLDSERVYVERVVGWGTSGALRNGMAEAYLLAAEQGVGAEKAGWLTKARDACREALKQGKAFRRELPLAMMLQGRFEYVRGKPAAAQRWCQRSLALAKQMEQIYDVGRVHLEIGRRLGQRSHLERAEAIFSNLGAAWDLARTREALRHPELEVF
jgi:tetratricopeptide (TPR) repeat protein